jgi:hypothetical protein
LRWVWGEAKRGEGRGINECETLRMLGTGKSQKEIAEALKLSEGSLSKKKASLIEEGFLTPDRKITPEGQAFLNRN